MNWQKITGKKCGVENSSQLNSGTQQNIPAAEFWHTAQENK